MEMRRARDNPMNWKILPDELPAVSAKPEQEKSRLVVPSAAAVAAIEASRQ